MTEQQITKLTKQIYRMVEQASDDSAERALITMGMFVKATGEFMSGKAHRALLEGIQGALEAVSSEPRPQLFLQD
jgi:hypothetical protein